MKGKNKKKKKRAHQGWRKGNKKMKVKRKGRTGEEGV